MFEIGRSGYGPVDVASTHRDDILLCVAGDVMTGRGIDQILGHPGDPELHERWMRSARAYVDLAERASGSIPRGVDDAYVWGDALDVLDAERPDVFVANLETAVTARGEPWPGKGIHYRMHPDNAGCLAAGGIDVAVLANNHVMDWSVPGLLETLDVLDGYGIRTAGAGRDRAEAWTPAVIDTPSGRVAVLGVCSSSSGVPAAWAAGDRRPGVALLPDLSRTSVERVASALDPDRPASTTVVSIHWGSNWGYPVEPGRRRFARRLVEEAGVDVVHGHSSHHPIGIEVHRGRPILYGCGDLLTDYEGIRGHEDFRGWIGGLYLVEIGRAGSLRRLELVPTRMHRFRVTKAGDADAAWLAAVLDRESRSFGTRVRRDGPHRLAVEW